MGSCSSLCWHRIYTAFAFAFALAFAFAFAFVFMFHTSPFTQRNGTGTGKAGGTRPMIGSPKIKADGSEEELELEEESGGSGFRCQKRWRWCCSPCFSVSSLRGLGSGKEGQGLAVVVVVVMVVMVVCCCSGKEGAKENQSRAFGKEETSVDADEELDAEEGGASWICGWGNEDHAAWRVELEWDDSVSSVG